MSKLPEDFLRNPERFAEDIALLESGNAPGWRRWSLNVIDDGKAREWARKSSWSLAEAEFLLFGLEAKQEGGTWAFFPVASNAGDTTDWFMRAIGAGNLVATGMVDGVIAYRPADLVASAKSGNIGLWQIWDGYLRSNNDSGAAAGNSNGKHSTAPEEIRKRAALIFECMSFWPTIERDLRDSSRNGLSVEAKFQKNTFWKVSEALTWAAQRGKITKAGAQTFVNSQPDSVLSPMLRALLKID